MTQLEKALRTLGLVGEVDLSGRWARLHGEQCAVYVVEAANTSGYYTWCDEPYARSVEFYLDPSVAIQTGLHRARGREQNGLDR